MEEGGSSGMSRAAQRRKAAPPRKTPRPSVLDGDANSATVSGERHEIVPIFSSAASQDTDQVDPPPQGIPDPGSGGLLHADLFRHTQASSSHPAEGGPDRESEWLDQVLDSALAGGPLTRPVNTTTAGSTSTTTRTSSAASVARTEQQYRQADLYTPAAKVDGHTSRSQSHPSATAAAASAAAAVPVSSGGGSGGGARPVRLAPSFQNSYRTNPAAAAAAVAEAAAAAATAGGLPSTTWVGLGQQALAQHDGTLVNDMARTAGEERAASSTATAAAHGSVAELEHAERHGRRLRARGPPAEQLDSEDSCTSDIDEFSDVDNNLSQATSASELSDRDEGGEERFAADGARSLDGGMSSSSLSAGAAETGGVAPRTATELAEALDMALVATDRQRRTRTASMCGSHDSDTASIASTMTYTSSAGGAAAGLRYNLEMPRASYHDSEATSIQEFPAGVPKHDSGFCVPPATSRLANFAHGCEHAESRELGELLEDFGGDRWPEPGQKEELSEHVMIRQLPFYACLHELPVSEDDRRGELHPRDWDDETERYVIGRGEVIVPQRYAIVLRGPMTTSGEGGLTPAQYVGGTDDSGKANLRRISRALEVNISETAVTHTNMQEVRIDIRVCQKEDASLCLNALRSHVVGRYYRDEAQRLDTWRKHYQAERHLVESAQLKKHYALSMNAAHQLAAEQIFAFFNQERDKFEVDLHHLRVHRQEAEIRLREAMLRVSRTDVDPDESEKYLEVIVGKGLHSRSGNKRLWPKMLELLQLWRNKPPSGCQRYEELLEVNDGSILVRFARYRGTSPCYGWFFDSEALPDLPGQSASRGSSRQQSKPVCPPCLRTWESTRVFVEISRERQKADKIWRQKCYDCFRKNASGEVSHLQWVTPVKLSRRRPVSRQARRYVPANQHRGLIAHNPALCELCLHLRQTRTGQSCDELPRFQKRFC